jgi:23S rRNA pseudouridine2605 synthase
MKKTPPKGFGKVSLARALSKFGYCSRKQADSIIRKGRVRVDGNVVMDPDIRVDLVRNRIRVDRHKLAEPSRVYIMLHKPAGLVTTASDDRGRETVYRCLDNTGLPRLVPVGRLDKESEGLLLFTNDTRWANRITDPLSGVEKIYRVRVRGIPERAFLDRMRQGIETGGDILTVRRVLVLDHEEGDAWLEIALDEGKNRHIRRLCAALGLDVVRLIRTNVGPFSLGRLAPGKFRRLDPEEARALVASGTASNRPS